jgi:hypothetical protein
MFHQCSNGITRRQGWPIEVPCGRRNRGGSRTADGSGAQRSRRPRRRRCSSSRPGAAAGQELSLSSWRTRRSRPEWLPTWRGGSSRDTREPTARSPRASLPTGHQAPHHRGVGDSYRRRVSRVDPARLADVADVLAEVRGWDGVQDRGDGTFYLRRRPFLHFHAGRDSRRADVRTAGGWVQIDLPEPASVEDRRRLLAVLRAEHADR